MKALLILVIIIQLSYSDFVFETCDCGDSHAFNEQTFTCERYPQPNQEGYIEGCQVYNVEGIHQKWSCVQCKNQYTHKYIQNNQYICIYTGIPNCYLAGIQTDLNQDVFLSSNEQKYKCYQCYENYYLMDNKCVEYPVKGDKNYIENCLEYDYYGKKCLKCNQGYKTKQSYCEKHQPGNAFDCFEPGYIFYNNQCLIPYQLIPNCNEVDTDQGKLKCSWCNSGYYEYDSICKPNPTTREQGKIKHCDKYTSNEYGDIYCWICESNYALQKDYKCKKVKNHIKNCQFYITNYSDQQVCSQCNENTVAFYNDSNKYDIIECRECPSIPSLKLQTTEKYEYVNDVSGFSQLLQEVLDRFNQLF